MSIINNIQGTLTQTQQIQHLNQQQLDKAHLQQQLGEVQNEVEHDEKRNTINEQENLDMGQLSIDGEKWDPRRRNPKKKTLEEEKAENEIQWKSGLGGGLIDTKA